MDTLFWTSLNPNLKIQHTTKLFFGKYAYRLELHCTGVAYLRGGFSSMTDYCQEREQRRQINWGGSWRGDRSPAPTFQERAFVESLENILPDYDADIKKRIEDPMMQLYTNDLNVMKSIASKLDASYLRSVCVPENQDGANMLAKGYILTAKPSKWQYRFNTREAKYSTESKEQLLAYLAALGDDVHLPQSLRDSLGEAKSRYIWGSYIYAHDAGIATMIKMINPHFIRSIDEFRCLAEDK